MRTPMVHTRPGKTSHLTVGPTRAIGLATPHDTGRFRVGCRIENHRDRARSAQVRGILVDTGSELSWICEELLASIGVEKEAKERRFAMANGRVVTRPIGFAVLRVDRAFTTDEVVFARPGDQQLLGARTLEGLNLMVNPQDRKLVAGGATLATGNVGVADSL